MQLSGLTSIVGIVKPKLRKAVSVFLTSCINFVYHVAEVGNIIEHGIDVVGFTIQFARSHEQVVFAQTIHFRGSNLEFYGN